MRKIVFTVALVVVFLTTGASACVNPTAPPVGSDPTAIDVLFEAAMFDDADRPSLHEFDVDVVLYAWGVELDANGVPQEIPAEITNYKTGVVGPAPQEYTDTAPISDWQRLNQGIVGASFTAMATVPGNWSLGCAVSDSTQTKIPIVYNDKQTIKNTSLLPMEMSVVCLWPGVART